MGRQCRLSDITKNYLSTFYCILDNMIQGMQTAVLTDSISHNFIVQMIPHHQAAIEMSKNILKYTTNLTLQKIASNIVSEQTKSIKNMQEVLSICSEKKNTQQDLCLFQRKMEQIMQRMFSNMQSACTSNRVNCNFMWEMIPHHKGAIAMSNNTLLYEICPELKSILQAIIVSQGCGISQMQNLLQCMQCC